MNFMSSKFLSETKLLSFLNCFMKIQSPDILLLRQRQPSIQYFHMLRRRPSLFTNKTHSYWQSRLTAKFPKQHFPNVSCENFRYSRLMYLKVQNPTVSKIITRYSDRGVCNKKTLWLIGKNYGRV